MSTVPPIADPIRTKTVSACEDCLWRARLLAALSVVLDYRSRDRERLLSLLALDEDALVEALGGRRRAELRRELETFDSATVLGDAAAAALCRHDPRFPARLDGPGAPRLLFLSGTPEQLSARARGPTVAVLGCRRASDYGTGLARDLARGLAASGVTIVAGIADRLSAAAHEGAREVDPGRTIAPLEHGLEHPPSARRRELHSLLVDAGSAIAELPGASDGRRWGEVARERVVVELAQVVLVVEYEPGGRAPWMSGTRDPHETVLAAVPGRVTSPLSRVSHALLRNGAHVVERPEDVLDLLPAERGGESNELAGGGTPEAALDERLRAMLEAVGAGGGSTEELARGAAESERRAARAERARAPWAPLPWGRRTVCEAPLGLPGGFLAGSAADDGAFGAGSPSSIERCDPQDRALECRLSLRDDRSAQSSGSS